MGDPHHPNHVRAFLATSGLRVRPEDAATLVSGHPASSHYSDQTELYVDGETLPWAFTRGAVQAAAEDTLVLTPAEG